MKLLDTTGDAENPIKSRPYFYANLIMKTITIKTIDEGISLHDAPRLCRNSSYMEPAPTMCRNSGYKDPAPTMCRNSGYKDPAPMMCRNSGYKDQAPESNITDTKKVA